MLWISFIGLWSFSFFSYFLSLSFVSLATLQLTSSKTTNSANMLPLHTLPAGALQRSQSLFTLFTSNLKLILANRNSRTIFYFLCVNLCKLVIVCEALLLDLYSEDCFHGLKMYIYREYFPFKITCTFTSSNFCRKLLYPVSSLLLSHTKRACPILNDK